MRSYRDGRDALARVLLAAQQVTLPLGQEARRSVRVARALEIRVEIPGRSERAPTLDISVGGLATWMALPMQSGDEASITLSLPRGEELRARARVVGVQRHDASTRSSVRFQFVDLAANDCERLEMYVFDAILEHLK